MSSHRQDSARSSKVSDDDVRAVRERIRAAEARIEAAMGYVMFPEVRDLLRNAHFDLEVALAIAHGAT